MDCIFCKIAQGKTSARKVYEDGSVIGILDINPISKGHTLMLPKKHSTDIFAIDEKSLLDLARASKITSERLCQKLGAKGVNILHASGKVAQQSVFHFHWHLVPRYEKDGLDTWPKSNYKERNFEDVLKKLNN